MNMKKTIAGAVSGALILLSPGTGCYQALAAVLTAGPQAAVRTVPGAAAGAGLTGFQAPGMRDLSGTMDIGLGGTLGSMPGTLAVSPGSAQPGVTAALPTTSAQQVLPAAVRPRTSAVAPGVSSKGKTGLTSPALRPRAAVGGEDKTGEPAATSRELVQDESLQVPEGGSVQEMPAEKAKWIGARIFDGIFRRNKRGGETAVQTAQDPSLSGRGAALAPSGSVEEASEKDEPPAPEAQESEKSLHLIYDLHKPGFRKGYVDATVWQAGDALQAKPEPKGFLGKRKAEKAWQDYKNGLAYRIAELYGDEAKGGEFLARAGGAESLDALAAEYLDGKVVAAPSLRGQLEDNDYVQGYLTAVGYRSAKQVLMPAGGVFDRVKPGKHAQLMKRDQSFLDGLRAALAEQQGDVEIEVEGREGKTTALERFDELMADAPKLGTQEIQQKLLYVLAQTLAKTYDKEALDEKLPFIPGKIRIPTSYLGQFIGHFVMIIFGIHMHMNAQPYLVYGLTGDLTAMGMIRVVHWSAYTASNFLPVGPVIDKTDYRVLFKGTSVVRAVLMGAIPLLWMSGHLYFAVLAAIVFINPIFQNLMTTSDSAAGMTFMGEEEATIKEISAWVNRIYAAASIVMPLVAGSLIGFLVKSFGDPGGYAMAYAVYAVMLLLAVPVFHFMVRDPRYHDPAIERKPKVDYRRVFEPLQKGLGFASTVVSWIALKLPYHTLAAAMSSLLGRLPGVKMDLMRDETQEQAPAGWLKRILRAVNSRIVYGKAGRPGAAKASAAEAAPETERGPPGLLRKAAASPAAFARWMNSPLVDKSKEAPEAHRRLLEKADSRNVDMEGMGFFERRIEKLARFFDRIEFLQGFAVILRSKTLSILMGVGIIQYFLEDALMFVVIPNILIEVIRPQAALATLSLLAPLLQGVPVLGALGIAFDAWLGALLGTKGGLMGAMLAIASIGGLLGTLIVSGPKGDLRIKRWGSKRMYRVAAVGELLFWLTMIPVMIVPPVVGGVAPAIPLPLFFTALGVFLFQHFLTRVLSEPVQIALAPVTRKQIPNDMVGKVSSAMTMFRAIFTGAGAVSVALVLAAVPIAHAVFWIGIGLTVTAALQWFSGSWLEKADPPGWEMGERKKARKP